MLGYDCQSVLEYLRQPISNTRTISPKRERERQRTYVLVDQNDGDILSFGEIQKLFFNGN